VSGAARAVFLDRDGTLTAESDWVREARDLVLLPGAARAVRRLNEAGWRAVLVTNQSAVARGMISETELAAIHAHLETELAREGARLDAIYACPHHPTEGRGEYRLECECRKPAPGMIARAARELGLDLARSWIVGDAARDLEAGARLGVRGVLVATGKGSAERARATFEHFAPDVEGAVEWILAAGG
jgi:D-glycero-D-manno-heptose 1,7-bisphosphate phosphatase